MDLWFTFSSSSLSETVFLSSTVPLRSMTLPSYSMASDNVVLPDLELPRRTTFLMSLFEYSFIGISVIDYEFLALPVTGPCKGRGGHNGQIYKKNEPITTTAWTIFITV